MKKQGIFTIWKKFMWYNFKTGKVAVYCYNRKEAESLIKGMETHSLSESAEKIRKTLNEDPFKNLNTINCFFTADGELQPLPKLKQHNYTLIYWGHYLKYEKRLYKPKTTDLSAYPTNPATLTQEIPEITKTTPPVSKINSRTVADIFTTQFKTFITKNKNYGNSFEESLNKYGLIAGLTRISDKFNRLETLIINNEQGTVDESLYDTLLDLSNYATMLAAYISNKERK